MSRFDAVLLIAFGGPQGLADIRPFLANVLRGRNVPASRVEEIARHYELFDGVSPITELTRKQADGLRQRLTAPDTRLPVYVGMRNWHPFLAETMKEMSRAGMRRILGLIMAPQSSYSSCEQYKENVRDARQALRDEGLADIEVTYVQGWHLHEGFIAANVAHVRDAIAGLPPRLQSGVRLVFTAHSIPMRMAARSKYREQLLESARDVARAAAISDWALVYQSRSGQPRDPWLEPDVCEYLRASREEGLEAAVLCPIGFVCDHIEVLYDLDREAADVARDVGLALTRAEAVNDHPRFLDTMADVVLSATRRYSTGRPLPIVARSAPAGSVSDERRTFAAARDDA